MATLKSISAMTRSRAKATIRVWQSSVVECPTRKLYPGSVLGHVGQESSKTVWRSSSGLSQHHDCYRRPNQLERWIRHNNCQVSHGASSVSNTDDRQYVCPSRLGQLFSQLVIMDNVSGGQRHYECPVSDTVNISKITPSSQSGNTEILEAPGGRGVADSKEAKEIMRIRHKKMKKHKLRKLRKRMYFLWRKQKATRKAKRDAIYWREISDIKKEAEDFSAEAFVKEQLERARKGGFYMNVLDSKV